jgi:hypothetical protein
MVIAGADIAAADTLAPDPPIAAQLLPASAAGVSPAPSANAAALGRVRLIGEARESRGAAEREAELSPADDYPSNYPINAGSSPARIRPREGEEDFKAEVGRGAQISSRSLAEPHPINTINADELKSDPRHTINGTGAGGADAAPQPEGARPSPNTLPGPARSLPLGDSQLSSAGNFAIDRDSAGVCPTPAGPAPRAQSSMTNLGSSLCLLFRFLMIFLFRFSRVHRG